jgi:ParB family chromosome partitioning protein
MKKLELNQIIVGTRHRQDLGDVQGLADSIRERGLLHPLVVTTDRRLIAGQRRLEVVRLLQWTSVPVTVATNLSDAVALLKAERDENTCRKDFLPTEAVALGRELEPLEKAEAAKRQAASQAANGQQAHKRDKPSRQKSQCSVGEGKFPSPQTAGKNGKTADKVGEAVGLSGKTYEKAKAVVQAAEADPELFGDLPAAMDQKGKVDPVYREMARRQEEGTKAPAKPQWTIDDDILKLYRLTEKLRPRWQTQRDKDVVRSFFTTLLASI